ncbi:MAG: DUF3080 family protein [Pseudomonadales bacterium]
MRQILPEPASLHQRAVANCSAHAGLLRFGLIFYALLTLTGCDSTAWENGLSRYLGGAARILEQSLPKPLAPEPIRVPPTQSKIRLGQQVEHRLDLLEYLKTTPCALHQLISERNSSLGQFAADSTRLIYDVEFLQQVDACIKALSQENPELADRLTKAAADKREGLPALLRTTILRGTEYRLFWKSPQTLGDYPAKVQSDLEVDIKGLVADIGPISNGTYKGSASDLDTKLSGFKKGEGGLMLTAWEDAFVSLTVVNKMIIAFQKKRPLCYLERTNPRAEQFRALVRTTFIGRIQPQISALNRRTYALMPLLRQLEDDLGASADPDFRSFIEARDQRIAAGRQALRDHVALIGDLFKSCGGLL